MEQIHETDRIVETCVVRNIRDGLNYARMHHTMIRITGQTGRGKTFAAADWAARDKNAVYVRIPAGCTRTMLLKLIARSFGYTGTRFTGPALADAVLRGEMLTEKNLLILDEAGHLMPRGSRSSTLPLELVRDIYDVCGCAVALIFTDVYIQDMETGYWKDFLEQFRGRITFRVDIPARIFREEVEQIVASFVPNPGQTLVDMAWESVSDPKRKDGNLRRLFENLKWAKQLAGAKGHALGADDLKVVFAYVEDGGRWPKGGR
ncbi:MAG: ATP-binding protein [Lentisphaeria bacterium]|nr:ATP-binding protein [Lentisphaeria bacterium]